MFKINDEVEINTPAEPDLHGKIGTVVSVSNFTSTVDVRVPGFGAPMRYQFYEVNAVPSDWSDTLDGLDVDELRSLASAALEKAFWLLTDAVTDK